jgi:hypothetical protein
MAVVPLVLAACGSSSANGSSTSTTKPSGTASETAYVACLKQHGVTLPNFGGGRPGGETPGGGETPPSFTPGSGGFNPGSGGGGFRNNPAFTKAASACKSLRPKGGFGGFNRGGAGGFNSAAFAAYRNCLKLHGVTLPTPGAKPATGSTTSTTTAQSNSTFQAAEQACAALRPTPSTTTTTS